MKKIIKLLIPFAFIFLILSCSPRPNADFSNLSFESKSFVYDATEHFLEIKGKVPTGYKVVYTNNGLTDVGSKKVIAEIRDRVDNTYVIFEATLSITKATYNMSTVSFKNETFEYDSKPHSIYVDGTLPEGVTVSYSGNEKTELGKHLVTANFIGSSNYNNVDSLTAYMFIVRKNYDLSSISFSDKTFDYDGKVHSIEIDGELPEGLSVIYADNSLQEIGSKEAIATIIDEFGDVVAEYKALIIVSNYTKELENIVFNDVVTQYDGTEHCLKLEGGEIPEGVNVKLIGDKLTIPGISHGRAEFYVNAQLVKVLTATLTVEKGFFDVSSIEFTDKTFVYDGTYHTLAIEGVLPQGIDVRYSKNVLRDEGQITVTALVSSPYYENLDEKNPLSLEANLRIIPYSFSVSMDSNDASVCATKNEIEITINKNISSESLKLLKLKAWQYLPTDEKDGWKKFTSDSFGSVQGEIIGIQGQTLSIPRYDENGYDGIYCKYYLVDKNNNIASGPFFVVDVETESKHNTTVLPRSKKGLCVTQNTLPAVSETQTKSVAVNVILNQLIMSGKNAGAIEFNSNGKTYYFCKDIVDEIDSVTHGYYGEGLVPSVCLILYVEHSVNEEMASLLSFPTASQSSRLWAVNTAQESSANYWIAAIEFLAERYSREDGMYGHVANFVIGNEIDKAFDWNSMCNYREYTISNDVYAQEYERTIRLANNAVKKYCSKMAVYSSLTYLWNSFSGTMGYGAYAPRDLMDSLNYHTKRMGDFNWGICFHPYSVGWETSYDVVKNDTESIHNGDYSITGNVDTTTHISFINMEVMDEYVNKGEIKWFGFPRSVIINESGITCKNQEQEPYQALSLAWAYYKACSLDSFVAFNYGYIIDSQAVFNQGIIYSNYVKKKSYDILKILDTESTFEDTNSLLSYASYYDFESGSLRTNINSFLDYMDVTNSGYNYSSKWSLAHFTAQ